MIGVRPTCRANEPKFKEPMRSHPHRLFSCPKFAGSLQPVGIIPSGCVLAPRCSSLSQTDANKWLLIHKGCPNSPIWTAAWLAVGAWARCRAGWCGRSCRQSFAALCPLANPLAFALRIAGSRGCAPWRGFGGGAPKIALIAPAPSGPKWRLIHRMWRPNYRRFFTDNPITDRVYKFTHF